MRKLAAGKYRNDEAVFLDGSFDRHAGPGGIIESVQRIYGNVALQVVLRCRSDDGSN